MKIIDLTHTISSDMPVFPGTERPKLTHVGSYEKCGYRETLMDMFSHTGTHMDAPRHIFPEGKPLEEFDVSYFIGKGFVIDASGAKEGGKIDISYIEKNQDAADRADYLLFYTGWDRYWGSGKYFGSFPVITKEVAGYMLDSGKRGIGLDVISLDPAADLNLTLHKYVLGSGRDFVIVENLWGLDRIGSGIFTFAALPVKYADADGAPVRAAAIICADSIN